MSYQILPVSNSFQLINSRSDLEFLNWATIEWDKKQEPSIEKPFKLVTLDPKQLEHAIKIQDVDLLKRYFWFFRDHLYSKLITADYKNWTYTPLHYAASIDSKDVVKFFVEECEADFNIPNSEGFSPIHLAAMFGCNKVLQYLKDKRAKICIAALDLYQFTPFHLACLNGHICCMRLLYNTGEVNINAQVKGGHTALLMAASEKNNLQAVKILINEWNADLRIKNYKGQSALQIAKENKNSDIAHYLENIDLHPFYEIDEKQFSIDIDLQGKRIVLGEGGSGTVFKGLFNDKPAAIKEMGIMNEEDIIREINLMARLQSRFIVEIYGYCFNKDQMKCWIVMEYMENGSISSFIRNYPHLLTSILQHQLLLEVSESVAYLHGKGSLHRDLKSENILLDKNLHPKICDFGISKLLHLKNKQNENNIMTFNNNDTLINTTKPRGDGTYSHMAPEVMFNQVYTSKSDIFSLAVIMWEILSKSQPWRHSSGPQVILNITKGKRLDIDIIPRIYRDLIKRCWKHSSSDRPHAAEIIKKLKYISQHSIRHSYNECNTSNGKK